MYLVISPTGMFCFHSVPLQSIVQSTPLLRCLLSSVSLGLIFHYLWMLLLLVCRMFLYNLLLNLFLRALKFTPRLNIISKLQLKPWPHLPTSTAGMSTSLLGISFGSRLITLCCQGTSPGSCLLAGLDHIACWRSSTP